MYPKIKLMVDLQTYDNIIEMYYPKMRDNIFKLITESGLSSGLLNYDSDISKIQIKDSVLNKCFLVENVDLIDCTIKGNIKTCDLFNCEILNSSVLQSNLFGNTTVKKSKIEDSYVSRNVMNDDCYIFGKLGVFSGEMNGGIFRKGRATNHAKFNNTEVIEVEKIK